MLRIRKMSGSDGETSCYNKPTAFAILSKLIKSVV